MKSFLLLLILLLIPPRISAEPSADTILLNGNIYTVSDAQPHAEAIAIKDSRIAFVGSNDEAKKFAGPQTRTIDLHRATVVPGLTDSHYHILGVGEREVQLNQEGVRSLDNFLAKVKRGSTRASRAHGLPVAVGSRLSGSRRFSRRARISTKLRLTIRFS